MTKYFYCQSYQSLILAIKMRQAHDVVVISGVPNILKVCEYLNVSYIKHRQYSRFGYITNSFFLKKEIKLILGTIGNDELHFSHTQYAVFCFILIKYALQKGTNVFFHDFEFIYTRVNSVPFSKSNILLLFQYQTIKMIFGAKIQLGMSVHGVYMICLDLLFLNNGSIHIINDKDNYFKQTLYLFKSIDIEYEPINILFIAQTFNDSNFFVSEKVNEIINLFNNRQVHVKMHPKLANNNILEHCIELPSFLPVEFFFKRVKSCIVSFHSASLITASQFENIKVISLLNIVGVDSDFTKKVKADLLLKSNNSILFPNSISELKKLIYNETV